MEAHAVIHALAAQVSIAGSLLIARCPMNFKAPFDQKLSQIRPILTRHPKNKRDTLPRLHGRQSSSPCGRYPSISDHGGTTAMSQNMCLCKANPTILHLDRTTSSLTAGTTPYSADKIPSYMV